jgi:hypothetical protein
MNCKYCGLALPEVKTGKRRREYCNNAHKQADYRQRHQVAGTAELKKELEAAKQRIQELERLVEQAGSTPRKKQPRHKIELVELGPFADLHGVSRDDAKRGITIGSLHPVEQDGKLMLDAHNQRTFWELNHNYGPWWRDCEACPHTEEETTTSSRKPSDLRPSANKQHLPEGCMLARDFAKMYGVPVGTFYGHMTVGIGKEKIEVSQRPKSGRNGETERYLTPEQQQAVLDYWTKHGVLHHIS